MVMANVFVTVGTTQFDKLISSVLSDGVLSVLARKGCKHLKLQIGLGEDIQIIEKNGIKISTFKMKSSIEEDILEADFIISHAGAGSCFNVLHAKKPLLVVINDDLMDNHQEELATQLENYGYLYKCNCKSLIAMLEDINIDSLTSFTPGNPSVYARHINNILGFYD